MDSIEHASVMSQGDLFMHAFTMLSEEDGWIFHDKSGTFRSMYREMLCVIDVRKESIEVVEDGRKMEIEYPCFSVAIHTEFSRPPSPFVCAVMEHVTGLLREQSSYLVNQRFRRDEQDTCHIIMRSSLFSYEGAESDLVFSTLIDFLEEGTRIMLGLIHLIQQHECMKPAEVAARIVSWRPQLIV